MTNSTLPRPTATARRVTADQLKDIAKAAQMGLALRQDVEAASVRIFGDASDLAIDITCRLRAGGTTEALTSLIEERLVPGLESSLRVRFARRRVLVASTGSSRAWRR